MSDPSIIISASSAQRVASPFRLNLEQQRKRAKELLKGLQAGNADALRRFESHHPQWLHPEQATSSEPEKALQLSEA